MKVRMTMSVDEHLAKKISEIAQKTGLSYSAILNICLRHSLPKLASGNLLEPSPNLPVRFGVLLVEDSESDAELLIRALTKVGFSVESQRVTSRTAMINAMRGRKWDLILADWMMPGFSGLEAVQLHNQSGLNVPLIIVSGRIGEEAAVDAIRAGADDYVPKDRLERLGPAVERALARRAKVTPLTFPFMNEVKGPESL